MPHISSVKRTLTGLDSIVLQQLAGTNASARILRAFLPILVLAMLADDIVKVSLSHFTSVNLVVFSAAFALLLIPFTVLIVIRVSHVIFQKAEKAEEARNKAEEALKNNEKRYRQLLENLGEGIGLVDPFENFIFANPAAERIFGIPEGGLIGRNLSDFLNPDQLSKVLKETEKRAHSEKSLIKCHQIHSPGRRSQC